MRKTLITLLVIVSLLGLASCNKVPTTHHMFNIQHFTNYRAMGTGYIGSPDNIVLIIAPEHADTLYFYKPLDSDEVMFHYKVDSTFFGEDMFKFASGYYKNNGKFKAEAYYEYIMRRTQPSQ